MKKILIPAILAAISLVAVGFVVQPVERASAVHTTLLGNFFNGVTTAGQAIIPHSSKVKFGELCGVNEISAALFRIGTFTTAFTTGNVTLTATTTCTAFAGTAVATPVAINATAAWRVQP